MADGNRKLIEQFLADGVNYMFGNPGTVEEGYLDVLDEYPDFKYITCLHESVAVAMADGYSRKTGKASLVQLHSGVGLGNGIGMIYQAMRGHSPIVVIAGEAGIKYDSMDAQMACNLVDMAKPVVKWAGRVTHRDSVLRMVRRAVKIALTPPCGPVYLTLPLDVLDEENNEDVIPTVVPRTDSMASLCDIRAAARLLAKASDPVFVIGDGVGESRAQKELEDLANAVGAKVYGADHSQFNFNARNPLFRGTLGHMFGENSRARVKDADVVFVCGTYLFSDVFPYLGNVFKENAKIIHVDLNTYEIAKNHRVDLGIAAGPKATVAEMTRQVLSMQSEKQKEEAADRKNKLAPVQDTPTDEENVVEMFVKRLSEKIGGSYVIFDEALTSAPYLEKYFPMQREGTYFQTRGGSLGVGIPGAMGVKLASPQDTVVAFTGDGGSMYTIQALNTAARYGIDVKVVILNNGSYKLLKNNINVYRKERGYEKQGYPDCFDLKPVVNFSMIAESMGVKGVNTAKVSRVSEVEEAVDKMLKSDEVFLVDLIV